MVVVSEAAASDVSWACLHRGRHRAARVAARRLRLCQEPSLPCLCELFQGTSAPALVLQHRASPLVPPTVTCVHRKGLVTRDHSVSPNSDTHEAVTTLQT